MSHNYRRPQFDLDLRPEPGPYGPSDRRRSSPDCDFYRTRPESVSSSSRASWSQDRTLSLLSSCGLEPSDLALLAELPEDILTVESLPQVLRQLKGQRGAVKPFPPSAPPSSSYPHSSMCQPAISSTSRDWDQPCSQSLQFSTGQVKPSPRPPDLDRWGRPRTCGSTRSGPPSSSSAASSNYVVDYCHGPEFAVQGKAGQDTGPGSSQHRDSFSSPATRLSEPHYRSAPKTQWGGRQRDTSFTSQSDISSLRNHLDSASIRSHSETTTPSKKEALDFHGMTPVVYPYSCALCDITVMSEMVWIRHINGTHHADGQLRLLQRFPNWDCRMEAINRVDSQSEKWKDKGQHEQQSPAASQKFALQTSRKSQKKVSEKSKVVCVKFPTQSVDKEKLRKVTEPFGKIIKILMFPSLAFVEFGSVEQAKDLVKFHENQPLKVNGKQIEFTMSQTFSFLQSSLVVSFFPAPSGENGRSDLMSIVKRFGTPLYTLFLPSMAFVEMKNTSEAQKLVNYYSLNTLRINQDLVKVSFSGEYKTLMRVPSAKRYEEESSSTNRTRSSSQEKEKETKNRRSSIDRGEQGENKTKTRSRSREISSKKKDRSTPMSSDKSSKEVTTRTRSKSIEKSIKDKEMRSRSREKSGKDRSRNKSVSRETSTEEKTTTSKDKSKDEGTRTRSKSRDNSTKEMNDRNTCVSSDKSSKEETTKMRSKSIKDQKMRSRSREKSGKDRSRNKSVSREKSTKEKITTSKDRTRSKSRERTNGQRRSRSRQKSDKEETLRFPTTNKSSKEETTKTRSKSIKDQKMRSRSRERSGKEETPRSTTTNKSNVEGTAKTRSMSREKTSEEKTSLAKDKSSTNKRTRSRSKPRDTSSKAVGSKSSENLMVPGTTEATESRSDPDLPCVTESRPEVVGQNELSEEEPQSSPESDIEGMEVIGEDGENLKDEDMETLDEAVREEEEEETSERTESPKDGKNEVVKDGETEEAQEHKENLITEEKGGEEQKVLREAICGAEKPEESRETTETHLDNEKEETDVPIDLDDYIALDELEEAQSDNDETAEEQLEEMSLVLTSKQVTTNRLTEDPRSKQSTRSSNRRSQRQNRNESSTTSGRRETPQKESKKTPTQESKRGKRKSSETKSASVGSPENIFRTRASAKNKSLKNESADKMFENDSASKLATKKTLENESLKAAKTAEEVELLTETCSKKESVSKKTPEESHDTSGQRTENMDSAAEVPAAEKLNLAPVSMESKILKRKCTDKDSGPEQKKPVPDKNQDPEVHTEETSGPDQPDLPKPQCQQEVAADWLDSVVEQQLRQEVDAPDLQKPTKPIGTEFVRPVVGYFCNLCQVIYADEDEAKVEHCSTTAHYRKYQEKTGKNPWTS